MKAKKPSTRNANPKIRPRRRRSRSAPRLGSGRTRRPAGKSHLGQGPWLKSALLLAVGCGLILLALGVHYYGRFNRLMEAFLNETPPRVSVYARSWFVRTGQHLSPEQFVRRLHRAGYRTGPDHTEQWFEVAGEGVRAVHREQGKRVHLEVLFRGDRVASLQRNGRDSADARFQPPYLSPLSDESRQKRKHLTVEELPQNLIHALLAAEDEGFFEHPGISGWGLLRAAVSDIRNWNRRQGGSTITQQFVKNYFLSSGKSFQRKLEEVFFAVFLERRFTKLEILGLYANEVYLGQLGSFAIHGFGQGAEAYFGKQVSELSLAECAVLAGIIQAPNRYSPHRNPEAVVQRRNYVLDQMEREDFITAKDNALARREPLQVRPASGQDSSEAPYFVDYLTARLPDELGDLPPHQNLAIYSTLDLDLQSAAYEAIAEALPEIEEAVRPRRNRPEVQVALLAVEPKSGEILALIGGRNYASAQYNRATRALRQPGSSFKPFVYAAALQSSSRAREGMTLATLILDEPYTIDYDGRDYSPANFGGSFHGVVTVRQALAESLNVPTVRIAEQAGFGVVKRYSEAFGFNRQIQPYPSIALGTFEVTLLELAQGYQALANQGKMVPLATIQRAQADGGTIRSKHPKGPGQVVSPEVAFLVSSALQSTLQEGTARSARKLGFQLPAAGKTGSTNDSWFVGYTPDLLCAVWVGTDQAPHLELTGAQAALPVWVRFMLKAQRGGHLSGADFAVPPGIVTVQIDPGSGLIASPGCSNARKEYFLAGTEPIAGCRDHRPVFMGEKADGRKPKRGRWSWLTRIFQR